MKNILSVLFYLSFSAGVFSQDISGLAIYQWKSSPDEFKKQALSDSKMDSKMKAFIEEKMKKMFSKTFVLEFDKNSSIYKELIEITNNETFTDMSANGVDLAIYKNIKDKTLLISKELMGKNFTVKDSLKLNTWKIENETKTIGNYICNKATFTKSSSQNEIDIIEKSEESENTTKLMKNYKPKDKTITVWYTPEIPINQGPELYWGLPGLILEVNFNDVNILCSKIVLKKQKKQSIKLKAKGKIVTLSQFESIVIKKNKELEQIDYMPGN